MYNIEIYITAEEDNEYDVDVFYEDKQWGWDRDHELSRGHYKTVGEAEDYVNLLKLDNGTKYYIEKIEYSVSASASKTV